MNGLKVFLLSSVLMFSMGMVSVSAQEALPEKISNLTCDAKKPCPQGLECFSFPEIGRRCAQADPCSYYKCAENTQCLIAASYPPQIICSPIGPPSPGTEETVEHAINLDENIQASDLGIGEPTILPDNPLYFLKNWARGIQSFFTFNPVAKSELKNKFANEKLLELKKTIEQKKNPKAIKKASENYQQEVERIKNQVEKIKDKAKENPQVESFLDKFIQQQTLHQKLLQKLENQVPPEAFAKIKESREAHLEGFQNVMLKLEDRKEKITEKLDTILEEQKGSQFKEFKNSEVLKNLEEKVPEQAKEAIQKAQENALKRLQGDLEKMSQEDQERFAEYTEKISGDKEKQLEILENLKSEIKTLPETPRIIDLKERLEQGQAAMVERIEKNLKRLDCPQWVSPGPGFCKEGRVIVIKDPETGCSSPPRCIIPGEIESPKKPERPEDTECRTECKLKGYLDGKCVPPPSVELEGKLDYCEQSGGVNIGPNKCYFGVCCCLKERAEKPEACITLWDPVCGKDGKTYSNECFAKLARVEIDYKGECKGTTCPKIMCVQDPCPGKHLPDKYGCVNCASPCPAGTITPPKPIICIQVITPALSPEGICKEFPTPCDVPAGWKKVDACPQTEQPPMGRVPAAPIVHKMEQHDGYKFCAILEGDENWHTYYLADCDKSYENQKRDIEIYKGDDNYWRYKNGTIIGPCTSAPTEYKSQCEQIDTWLNQKIVEWKPSKYSPMVFGTMNNVFLQGLLPYEFADKYEHAIEETGVDFTRMDIPKLSTTKEADAVASLGELVKSTQSRGKKVMIGNNANGDKMYFGSRSISWNEYSEKQKEYIIAAANLHPDYIAIMIEPNVIVDPKHERHLNFNETITPQMWAELINELADIVKKGNPNTKTALGIIPQIKYEQEIFSKALTLQNMDIVGADVYGLLSFEAMDQVLVPQWKAKQQKAFWIMETWLGFEGSEDQQWKKDIDAKWIKAMTYYSQQNNITGLNVFFSKHFFAYEKDVLSNTDKLREALINNTQRTPAFYIYKALIKEVKNNM